MIIKNRAETLILFDAKLSADNNLVEASLVFYENGLPKITKLITEDGVELGIYNVPHQLVKSRFAGKAKGVVLTKVLNK